MIGNSLDSRSKDIDNLIDMMVNAQKENGIKVTMTEALFDPNTKERINIFRRRKLEKEGVDLTKYGAVEKSCNKCNKCGEKTISNIERGIFVYNEDDLIDEEEGEYVCEYCTKIGYDSSYKPDICDTCDDCEGCTEYINGVCDGCQYSLLYNGGSSYGQISNENVSINSEDEVLFDEIENGGPDYEVEFPDGGFTIMNF